MVILCFKLLNLIWEGQFTYSFSPEAERQRHNDDSSLLNIKPATIHHPDHRSWALTSTSSFKFKYN